MALSDTVKRFAKRWTGVIEYRKQQSENFEGKKTWSDWISLEGFLEEDAERINNNADTTEEVAYESHIVTLEEFDNNVQTEIRLFGNKIGIVKDVRRERDSTNTTIYTIVFK
jgi:hypothetical protein